LLPTAAPFKSYHQSPEHGVMPINAQPVRFVFAFSRN
jgi:hypothetical protein